MSTENQKDNGRNVVWENRKQSTRFMTTYHRGKTYEDDEHHLVIGENLSYDDALILVKVTEIKNIGSFLDNLPTELRDPRTDAMIAGIIRGSK